MSAAAATAGPPDAGTKRKADDLGAVSEDDGDLDAPVLGGGGGRSKLVKHGRECPFIDTVNRKVLVRRCLAGPALLAGPVLSAAQLAPHPASPPALARTSTSRSCVLSAL
jgi:hypothetical protein